MAYKKGRKQQHGSHAALSERQWAVGKVDVSLSGCRPAPTPCVTAHAVAPSSKRESVCKNCKLLKNFRAFPGNKACCMQTSHRLPQRGLVYSHHLKSMGCILRHTQNRRFWLAATAAVQNLRLPQHRSAVIISVFSLLAPWGAVQNHAWAVF